MADTTRDRFELHHPALEVFDEKNADTLMKLLNGHPSADLATRDDVLSTANLLRGEMAELRAEVTGDMTQLRAELEGWMAELRTELTGDVAGLQGEIGGLRGEMAKEFGGQRRWLGGVIVANNVALLSLMG